MIGVEVAKTESGGARGRPRNETVGPAILAAARALVIEDGYERVTVQMIAEAAGTGKQTVYRRWPGKATLVLDAFVEHAESQVDAAVAEAPLDEHMRAFLERTFAALERTGGAVRGLMAYAQTDPEFRDQFLERFIQPRRRAFRRVLEAAVARGELPASADLDAAVSAAYGALWYRLLLGEQLDAAFAGRLARLVRGGLVSAGEERPPG